MSTTASRTSPGAATGGVRALLRLEGLLLLAVCTLAYATLGAGWWWFLGTFLAPDLALIAFLAGPVAGARAYNAAHSVTGPLLLAVAALAGVAAEWPVPVALIWGAHIGFDRALGYGLKYQSGFADTHLGPIGRRGDTE